MTAAPRPVASDTRSSVNGATAAAYSSKSRVCASMYA